MARGGQERTGARDATALRALPWLLCAAALAAPPVGLAGETSEGGSAAAPYHELEKSGTGFLGRGREAPDPAGLETIRIGLTGPARSRRGRALQAGARIALEQANAGGGCRGTPFELVFLPDDGPWGTAAKAVVRLAYDEAVWAILGSVDGAHAHLAELVAARAWIPVLTPAAGDRSIDYANVPWVFRLMPDDARQARLLLRLARDGGARRLAVLAEGTRDARQGRGRIEAAARRERFPIGLALQYPPHQPLAVVDRIAHYEPDAVIVWGLPEGALPLIRALRERGIVAPVYGPALLATPDVAREAPGTVVVAAPCDLSRDDPALAAFRREYREREEREPGPVAVFAYDGMRVLVEAIRAGGLNRARIRDALARTEIRGLSGAIRFSALGGNPAEPVPMTAREGRWAPLEGGAIVSEAARAPQR